MEVKELGHVVLYVRDLERSRRFYGDVLGWRRAPGRRVPGRGGVLDRSDPPRAAADRGRSRRDADPGRAAGSGCTTSA